MKDCLQAGYSITRQFVIAISHTSEIVGMDFFAYLDEREFSFLILKISEFGAELWPFIKYP